MSSQDDSEAEVFTVGAISTQRCGLKKNKNTCHEIKMTVAATAATESEPVKCEAMTK